MSREARQDTHGMIRQMMGMRMTRRLAKRVWTSRAAPVYDVRDVELVPLAVHTHQNVQVGLGQREVEVTRDLVDKE